MQTGRMRLVSGAAAFAALVLCVSSAAAKAPGAANTSSYHRPNDWVVDRAKVQEIEDGKPDGAHYLVSFTHDSSIASGEPVRGLSVIRLAKTASTRSRREMLEIESIQPNGLGYPKIVNFRKVDERTVRFDLQLPGVVEPLTLRATCAFNPEKGRYELKAVGSRMEGRFIGNTSEKEYRPVKVEWVPVPSFSLPGLEVYGEGDHFK
jgi:hypothetical protein